jgi:hypothetical protein
MTRLWPDGEPLTVWGGDTCPATHPPTPSRGRDSIQGIAAVPGEETPGGFFWGGGAHAVLKVHNRWRVHTRWWTPEGELWREYVKVTTDTELLCLIYRDLVSGGWFLARVYD